MIKKPVDALTAIEACLQDELEHYGLTPSITLTLGNAARSAKLGIEAQ